MNRHLLAAVDSLHSMKRGLYGGTGNHDRYIMLGCVIVAFIWAGMYFWDQLQKRRALLTFKPRSVFEELCVVHALGGADIALLRKIAAQAGCDPDAEVFLSPAVLQQALAKHPDSARQLVRLANRIYGDDLARQAAIVLPQSG